MIGKGISQFMTHTGRPIFIATTIFMLAACHSVHTQTNPPNLYSEAPPVLSIRAQQPASVPTPSLNAPQPLTLNPSTPSRNAMEKPVVPAGPKYTYNSVNIREPYIAITFDDGPSPELTPKLLDMLKERGIHATFYVVGTNAAAYPDILRRMVAEGHEIGNHSWSHPALTKVGAGGVQSQMEKTNAAIFAAVGANPKTMRPPYGATNATITKRLNEEFGMKVIIWSVDPLDWKYRNADRVANTIISQTHPGAIILAHDIHPTTVAAMPRTFDALLAKGYKFVTVSELIKMDEASAPKAQPSPTPSASPSLTETPATQ